MTGEALAFRFWRVRDGVLSGISAAAHLRQRWEPGLTRAAVRCSVDPAHEAPAPDCLCGLYVVPGDLPTVLDYLRRMTLGRAPSTPVAVGAVRTVGPRLPAYPWPLGDPPGTVRVGAAEILGPLHLYPGDEAAPARLAARYGVAVVAADLSSAFPDWLARLTPGE